MKMYAELKQKQCTRCGEKKETTDFYMTAGKKRLRSECKLCSNERTKEYRNTDNGKAAVKRARDNYLSRPDNVSRDSQNKAEWSRFKKYKIVKSEYVKMLEQQDYRCLICSKSHNECKNGLVVDHCHSSGEVRGLLCPHCNSGLGFFKDNEQNMLKAVKYLNKLKK